MPQRRRLEDLYVVGKEIEFDDGKGEPVTVWLRKLNPVEQSTALRKANAQRARVRTAGKNPATDEYQALMLEVIDMGEDRELLVDYIVMDKVAEATLKAEARVATEEEWSKDDYIQGLRDAWNDGLRESYIADPEHGDAEAVRVFDELKRFNEAAREVADQDVADIKAEYSGWSIERLRERTLEIQLVFRGNSAWLEEFHRSEVWLATFEQDRKSRYYEKREEVDRLPGEVLSRLLDEYAELSVDVIEGKGSEETHDSSPSSEQPDAEATGDSSGLAAVTP